MNITGGTGTYTISIARADTKQNVKTHRDVTSSTDLFDELGVLEGTYYEVVIKDSNDCTMTKNLVIHGRRITRCYNQGTQILWYLSSKF